MFWCFDQSVCKVERTWLQGISKKNWLAKWAAAAAACPGNVSVESSGPQSVSAGVSLSVCWPPILLVGKLLNRIREKQCLHWWVRRPFFWKTYNKLTSNPIKQYVQTKLNSSITTESSESGGREYSAMADYRTAWRPAQHRLAKQNNFLIIPSEQ